MSVELMSAVWKLDLPTNRKVILLKMADVADDDGSNSFQSIEYLAAHTGQSERTVKRHRMGFEKLGILVVEAYGKGGRGRFKKFRIVIDRAREIYGNIKPLGKGAKLTPFGKGANGDKKGVKSSTKGCQSLAPDSSLFISKDSSRADAGAAPRGAPASALARNGVSLKTRDWKRAGRWERPMTNPRRRAPVLPTPAADDGPWQQAKAAAAERHGAGPVGTWLTPVVYLGMDGGAMKLGAPSNTIRDHALALLTNPEAAGPPPAMKYDIAISPGYALMKEVAGNDRAHS